MELSPLPPSIASKPEHLIKHALMYVWGLCLDDKVENEWELPVTPSGNKELYNHIVLYGGRAEEDIIVMLERWFNMRHIPAPEPDPDPSPAHQRGGKRSKKKRSKKKRSKKKRSKKSKRRKRKY